MQRIYSAPRLFFIITIVLSGCGMKQEVSVNSNTDDSLSDWIMDHARVSYFGPEVRCPGSFDVSEKGA